MDHNKCISIWQIALSLLVIGLFGGEFITSIYLLSNVTDDYFSDEADEYICESFFGWNIVMTVLNFADLLMFLLMIRSMNDMKHIAQEQNKKCSRQSDEYMILWIFVGVLEFLGMIVSGMTFFDNVFGPSDNRCSSNHSVQLYHKINYVVCGIRIISWLSAAVCGCLTGKCCRSDEFCIR